MILFICRRIPVSSHILSYVHSTKFCCVGISTSQSNHAMIFVHHDEKFPLNSWYGCIVKKPKASNASFCSVNTNNQLSFKNSFFSHIFLLSIMLLSLLLLQQWLRSYCDSCHTSTFLVYLSMLGTLGRLLSSDTIKWETFNDYQYSWTGVWLVQALCWIINICNSVWVGNLVWNISRILIQQLCYIFDKIFCGLSFVDTHFNNMRGC